MEEQYVVLPQYPHYRIYRDGRVFREEYTREHQGKKILLPMKEISQHVSKNGYPALWIRNAQDNVVKVYTHRLLWMAFKGGGEIPKGMEISHINSERLDCRPENLCLESHQQNMNNPITLLRFRWSNSRKKGKYDRDRLMAAQTKEYEDHAIMIYQLMSDGGKKTVKIMDYMALAHIGFYRAKRIMNEYVYNNMWNNDQNILQKSS